MLDELRPTAGSHHSLIQYVEDRPGHDRRYAMDITKIRHDLRWAPRHTLAEGLQKTVEWYLEHADWTDAIRRQLNFGTWIARNYDQREGPA
jgi:dTDP-glucose 4,6-dehydratase